jgi:hypothetical protein
VFAKEPSFFTGAMYISYAMNVALVVTLYVATRILLNDPDIWVYFAVFVPAYLPFIPLIFRYSRTLLLYIAGDLR